MEWILLAPGPSMSQELADSVRGHRVGVVSNAYELAPWADFLAATDSSWWRSFPSALEFEGDKFSPNHVKGVERVKAGLINSSINSGVLGLECAKRKGATRIMMVGFDMHGSHFFGEYKNGLKNTSLARRRQHIVQFKQWARGNKHIDVINCTPGSHLKVFPFGDLSRCLEQVPAVADRSMAAEALCLA